MKNLIVLVALLLFVISTQARWKKSNTVYFGEINSLTASGGTLFAATEKGIFITTDNGDNWIEKNNGLTNLYVNSIVVKGEYIFAATDGGVFLSTNNGDEWSGVLIKEGSSTINTRSLAIKDGIIFAATNSKGVYLSKDNGKNWKVTNSGLTSLDMRAISVGNKNIFVGTYDNGLFRSTNNGDSWSKIDSGLTDKYILSITANGDSVFVGTLFKGLFLTTDEGANWKPINTGLTKKVIRSIAVRGSNVFAAAMGGDGGGIFQSEDYGANWKMINDGLNNYKIKALCFLGDKLFLGDRYGFVWTQAVSDLITSIDIQNLNSSDILKIDQNFPNPFNTSTTIKYNVGNSEGVKHVTLKVYNILGNEIQTLVNDKKEPGNYYVSFNGDLLSGGIYYYKLSSGNYSVTKRMVLNK